MEWPTDDLIGIATALGIGLLVGVERERAKGAPGHEAPAGVRTFALVALAGATAALIGSWALALAGLGVVGYAVVGYRATPKDPGLTTEIAMLIVFLLGALAHSRASLAGGIGVLIAVLLASKGRMHRFSRELLSERELRDGLVLAAAALIVLPLLPDRALDPWGVFNLQALWRLVVLVMAIQALGYIALRLFGPDYGLAIAGFAGGFASSTATIASMGARAREEPELMRSCVSAALMSNVATVILLGIVTAALNPSLTWYLAPALAGSGLVVVAIALLASLKAFREAGPSAEELAGRPFRILHALLFAAVVGAVLLAAALLNRWLGDAGATLGAAVAGFADAHAAAAAAAQLEAAGNIDMRLAGIATAAGFATNTASKLVVALVTGGTGYALRLLPGLLAMIGSFAVIVWLF